MMKNIILPVLLAVSTAAFAQTADEAGKQFYYERYQSAANTAHASLKNNPQDAAAWYWLTQSYLQQDKLNALKDSLNLAPAETKADPLYRIALGQVLLQEGKNTEAQIYFEQALKQTKQKNATVLAAVANAQISAPAGDANYAIELLNKAIKRDKKNASYHVAIGNAYRKLKNGSESYRAYQEALSKDANNAAALYQLGQIFATQKNTELYLDFFNKAIAADAQFSPAYYSLYVHYYIPDATKSMEYFKKYVQTSDKHAENDYAYTDLLYLTRQYPLAISHAEQLLKKNPQEVRLHKLIAYSLLEQKDTANAVVHMQTYFAQSPDSVRVMKDYETIGALYMTIADKKDSAIAYYEKATQLIADSTDLYNYYKKLAALSGETKNYAAEANWLSRYYKGNAKATNVDLFNWGLASFRAGDFIAADTVFGKYVKDHPEQGFGYYWQARSNAAIDTAMTQGLAIPHYTKLVEVMQNNTSNANYKKWLVEAYGYLAAYETNTRKDYAEAVDYFEKLLVVDPENQAAQRYITMLEKKVNDEDSK